MEAPHSTTPSPPHNQAHIKTPTPPPQTSTPPLRQRELYALLAALYPDIFTTPEPFESAFDLAHGKARCAPRTGAVWGCPEPPAMRLVVSGARGVARD